MSSKALNNNENSIIDSEAKWNPSRKKADFPERESNKSTESEELKNAPSRNSAEANAYKEASLLMKDDMVSVRAMRKVVNIPTAPVIIMAFRKVSFSGKRKTREQIP